MHLIEAHLHCQGETIMSKVTHEKCQGETVMSKVTHERCSCRDTKSEERIFEAWSFSCTENHPTIHPLVREEMRRRNVPFLRHVNAIQTPMISGARSRRVAEKRGDRGRVAKYHASINGGAHFHPRPVPETLQISSAGGNDEGCPWV